MHLAIRVHVLTNPLGTKGGCLLVLFFELDELGNERVRIPMLGRQNLGVTTLERRYHLLDDRCRLVRRGPVNLDRVESTSLYVVEHGYLV